MVTRSIEMTVYEKGKKAPKYSIDSDLNGEMSLQDFLEYSRSVIVSVAKDVLSDSQSKGFDKDPVVIVDGKYGRKEESVKPLGSIDYVSKKSASDILIFAYEAILERTKRVTGRYGRNNIVVFNGNQVANDKESMRAWIGTSPKFKDRDRIRFINTAPYANKLELDGVTKGSVGTSGRTVIPKTDKKGRPKPGAGMRKPNGVYTLALRAIRHKYRGNSIIKYEQVLGSEMGLTSPVRGSGVGRVRQKGKSAGRTYVYPSILIYIKEGGIL